MTARFRYRAASLDGRLTDGELRAESRRAALDELRRQSLYAIRVEEVESTPARRWRATAGPGAARALWARSMAAMLGAGLPMDRALEFVAEQVDGGRLAGAAREVRDAVRGGAPLSQALRAREHDFGTLLPAAAEAGEASGALPESLERAAAELEALESLRGELRAALVYPAIMAFAIGAGVTVLLLVVVPRFAAMLTDVGGQLPLSTRVLVGTSGLLTGWWWLWIGLAVVGGGLAQRWLADSANRRRFHAARLGWPLVGQLERAWVSAQFTRTLALLLRAGTPILGALAVARAGVTNLALAVAIAEAEDAVRSGQRLAPSLAGVVPPLAARMLAAGEESGRLDELALRAAQLLDDDVRRTIRAMVALVEPAMILLLGAVVGFVALAMIQAIYAVNATL